MLETQMRNSYGIDLTAPKKELPPELREKYRKIDFHKSYLDFPEIGEGKRRDKAAVLEDFIPTSVLISAAGMVLDLQNNLKVSAELVGIYHLLAESGYFSYQVKYLPEHLIGYVVNFVEDDFNCHELTDIIMFRAHYFGFGKCSAWSDAAQFERDTRKKIRELEAQLGA